MTARALLIRGLVAGLLAGFATFLVAHEVGEPAVEAAIALEGSAGAAAHTHDDPAAATDGHSHDEEEAVVSRGTQRTWGLLTGSVVVGTALGGLVALVTAGVAGRVGRLRASTASAVVALAGFVAVALVPWLKYPANPPAVGDPATIGDRTTSYFVFLLISLAAAVVATVAGQRAWSRWGSWAGVVVGLAAYLLVVGVAAGLMPRVDELGDFPASTLWEFRRASLLTLATLWATIGVVLSGLLTLLERDQQALAARRALAASL